MVVRPPCTNLSEVDGTAPTKRAGARGKKQHTPNPRPSRQLPAAWFMFFDISTVLVRGRNREQQRAHHTLGGIDRRQYTPSYLMFANSHTIQLPRINEGEKKWHRGAERNEGGPAGGKGCDEGVSRGICRIIHPCKCPCMLDYPPRLS